MREACADGRNAEGRVVGQGWKEFLFRSAWERLHYESRRVFIPPPNDDVGFSTGSAATFHFRWRLPGLLVETPTPTFSIEPLVQLLPLPGQDGNKKRLLPACRGRACTSVRLGGNRSTGTAPTIPPRCWRMSWPAVRSSSDTGTPLRGRDGSKGTWLAHAWIDRQIVPKIELFTSLG